MTRFFGRVAVLAAMLAGGFAADDAQAAPPAAAPADPAASAKSLAPGAYWMPGRIANSGFIVGDAGVIVIDAQFTPAEAEGVLAEIARIAGKPIDTVILTHSDPDHINGLTAFPRGLLIIAQTETRREIEEVVARLASNGPPPAAEIRDYVPNRTVERSESLVLDGMAMTLIHTAPAHTDGDLIVYLPAQKVVFAGDLLTPAIGAYPGVHLDKHGSSLGWIAAVEAMLALDADIFVGGHGEPMTRAEVAARLSAAQGRRNEIAALVDRGLTLPQIKAALNDAPLPGPASRFPTFVDTTYQELAAH